MPKEGDTTPDVVTTENTTSESEPQHPNASTGQEIGELRGKTGAKAIEIAEGRNKTWGIREREIVGAECFFEEEDNLSVALLRNSGCPVMEFALTGAGGGGVIASIGLEIRDGKCLNTNEVRQEAIREISQRLHANTRTQRRINEVIMALDDRTIQVLVASFKERNPSLQDTTKDPEKIALIEEVRAFKGEPKIKDGRVIATVTIEVPDDLAYDDAIDEYTIQVTTGPNSWNKNYEFYLSKGPKKALKCARKIVEKIEEYGYNFNKDYLDEIVENYKDGQDEWGEDEE